MSELIGLIQWPAFAASLIAAWLVGSKSSRRRNYGFWVFLASNVLWIVWGLSTSAWALCPGGNRSPRLRASVSDSCAAFCTERLAVAMGSGREAPISLGICVLQGLRRIVAGAANA